MAGKISYFCGMKWFVTLVGLLVGLSSCTSGGQQEREGGASGQSTGPEKVVRSYQEYIDNNQFEQAKSLSTREEQQRLDELADLLAGELQDSTILNSKFLELECEVKGDMARCYCLIRDQYETYETIYTLVRRRSRWLIAAPEEEFPVEDPAVEEMLEELQ